MHNHYRARVSKFNPNVIHAEIEAEAKPLSYGKVLDLWQYNPDFQSWYSDLLANCEFRAFRWETPPVTTRSLSRKFEFVFVNADTFASRPARQTAFEGYFDELPVTAFENLGKDSLMIVPAPLTSDCAYGHMAAFVRQAPASQKSYLWETVGKEMNSRINESPIWLNTAGGGVPWLHIRLDTRPKYYHFSPYRNEQSNGK